MIQLSDNLGYKGPKANFERDSFQTIEEMKSCPDADLDNGHVSFCVETLKHYEYLSSNVFTDDLGRWREYKPLDSVLNKESDNSVANKPVAVAIDDLLTKYNDLKSSVEGIVIDDELNGESENAVQNKIITAQLTSIGTEIAQLAEDALMKANVDNEFNNESENPVQNKVITAKINDITTSLANLKTRIDKVEPVDTALDTASARPLQNKVIAGEFAKLSAKITNIEADIDGLKYFSSFSYCVADWTENDLKPTANDQYGDPELLRSWDFYLVNHSGTLSEDGTALKPEAKLKRNNILRKTDGSFAKTVFTNLNCKGLYKDSTGTQKSAFATGTTNLYSDANCTILISTAANFDSAAFWNNYGKNGRIWINDNGTKREISNIPRPWEEYQKEGKGFDDGVKSVVLSYPKKVYLVDQLKGESGKIWKGVFFEPCYWDGIDVSLYPLDTIGIFPSPATSVTDNSKQKMFCRYVEAYNPTGLTMSANCQGHLGEGNISKVFMSEDLAVNGVNYKKFIYGRSYDVSQLTNCTWARNNNADPEKPYPFAEGGYHSRNTFVSSQECLYKTKYLNESNFFASGISANDAVSNEAQWKKYGGIRWKRSTSSTWSYGTWNTTPDICYNSSGGKTHFNALLSWWFPKEQVLESQTAASYAVEAGVNPGEEYNFYGSTWWYANVPGAPGLQDGEMNCIIYKKIPATLAAYDSDGYQTNFNLEIILRMSLMNGYNHSGDYWIYYGGGYEQVGTVTVAENGSTGNPVHIYTCFDQRKWRSNTELQTVSLNNLGRFIFEDDPNYWLAWQGENLGDSYTAVRPSYTAYKSKAGGSLGTGECFWSYTAKHWSTTLNQRIRVGVKQRCPESTSSNEQIRKVGDNTIKGLNQVYRTIGGSGQVLLKLD